MVTNVKALSLYFLVVRSLGAAPEVSPIVLSGVMAIIHVVMLLSWLTLVGAIILRVPGASGLIWFRLVLLIVAAAALLGLGAWSIVEALS